MPDDDFSLVRRAVLENADAWFPDRTPARREELVKSLVTRLSTRTLEDKREAAKLACEIAKLFVTIAIAVLGALALYSQGLAVRGLLSTPEVGPLLLATALALLVSMTAGTRAISRIYRRAEGRDAPWKEAWSVDAARPLVGVQAAAGLLSLILFAALITASPAGLSPVPAGARTACGFSLAGEWAELRIEGVGQTAMTLPSQTWNDRPVIIGCR